MTAVTLLAGDPWAGPRLTRVRIEQLTLTDAPNGDLDGIQGGRVDYSRDAEIRSSGSLSWSGLTVPDWLTMRIKPWIEVTFASGESREWPLGVFIPSTPDVTWAGGAVSADVDLYDKLVVLRDDAVGPTYALAAGTVVTTAVRSLLTGAGESRMAVTDSTETLRSPMTWEPGTSRLRIINDLLASINYFAVWFDGDGVARVEPYVRPQDRDVALDLTDTSGLLADEFRYSRDTFGVPNVVTLTTPGEGYIEGLSVTARNTNPDDPLSVPRRGREVEVVEQVEATSLSVLTDMAKRRLVELSQPSSALEVQAAPRPLLLNDAVRFSVGHARLSLLSVVQSMTVELDPLADLQVRLVEVLS